MGLTSIAWADYTFNLWIGCRKVSPGCAHCYAESYARRFWGDPWKTGVYHVTSPQYWKQPLAWDRKAAEAGRPATVFCGSLCDICDPAAPEGAIDRLKGLIEATPHLIWLLLTKRPERLGETFEAVQYWSWLSAQRGHIWIGVSCEDQQRAEQRLGALVDLGFSSYRGELPPVFVSAEPLLGQVDLTRWLRMVRWVIAGGETGPGARRCAIEWLDNLVMKCAALRVPAFIKQAGHHCVWHGRKLAPTDIGISTIECWREVPAAFSRPDPARLDPEVTPNG